MMYIEYSKGSKKKENPTRTKKWFNKDIEYKVNFTKNQLHFYIQRMDDWKLNLTIYHLTFWLQQVSSGCSFAETLIWTNIHMQK